MENGKKNDPVAVSPKDARSNTEQMADKMSGQSSYGKIAVIIIAVILLLLASVAAINFMLTGSVFQAESCTYEGLEFASGSEIDIDSCNSCSCTDGEIQCTTIACEEENGGVNIDDIDTSRADVYTLICGSFEEPFSADVSMNIPEDMFVSDVVFLDDEVGEECYVKVSYLSSSMIVGLAPGTKTPVQLVDDMRVAFYDETEVYLTKVVEPGVLCAGFEMDATCTGYLAVYSDNEESKYYEGILGVGEIEGSFTGLAKVAISPEDIENEEEVLEKFSEFISGSKIDVL